MTFRPEENDMEAENSGGEEDEDPGAGRGGGRPKKEEEGEEEEFNLEEVLRLGGTQVSLPDKTSRKAQMQPVISPT